MSFNFDDDHEFIELMMKRVKIDYNESDQNSLSYNREEHTSN